MRFTRQTAPCLWWGIVLLAVPSLAAQEPGDTARAAQEVAGPDLMPRDTAPDSDTSVTPTPADTARGAAVTPDTARGAAVAPDTARGAAVAPDTARGAAVAPDTTTRDTSTSGYSVPRDTVPVDSAKFREFPDDTVRADTLTVGEIRVEPEAAKEDTSLTARMDVRRGGGLRRSEFPDLRETAALTGYRTFLRLLDQSRIGEEMRSKESYTLLAPTDSAFARVPPAELARLESDTAALRAWMRTLVLEGSLTGNELLERGVATSLSGRTIAFSRDSAGALLAGDAVVVQPDLLARDGVVQGLDRVTLPDAATAASP